MATVFSDCISQRALTKKPSREGFFWPTSLSMALHAVRNSSWVIGREPRDAAGGSAGAVGNSTGAVNPGFAMDGGISMEGEVDPGAVNPMVCTALAAGPDRAVAGEGVVRAVDEKEATLPPRRDFSSASRRSRSSSTETEDWVNSSAVSSKV